ncbi:MAG: hypothetical protein B6U65_03190 [Candidatus Wolframiiraptor sp. EX4484-121]|nr:MAG: hypothetical protein B6U65_03190 [Candidatus Wolframiiraptor sp. EX4484-121]
MVVVEAGSRIHLGFIDLSGDLGRTYGSIGLYLEKPGFKAIVRESDEVVVEGEGGDWIQAIVRRIVDELGLRGLWVKILSAIPRHVGLGSTTQTILGIASAVSKLHGLDLSVEHLAYRFGRGRRSGAGVWLFKYGGLAVDCGRCSRTKIPPLLTRVHVPEKLRVILASPRTSSRGFEEEVEDAMFERVKTDPRLSERASRIVLMKLLPSLIEGDLRGFGEAATELDRINGLFFEEVQLGVYRRGCEIIVEKMLEAGALGAGQSSWGPIVYGFADSDELVEHILESLKGFWIMVSKPRNMGAEIRREFNGITGR